MNFNFAKTLKYFQRNINSKILLQLMWQRYRSRHRVSLVRFQLLETAGVDEDEQNSKCSSLLNRNRTEYNSASQTADPFFFRKVCCKTGNSCKENKN